MYINKLSAAGFRNLNISGIELSPNINILHGNNAQGKTNFLEAVYFCGFGRSMRGVPERELICFGQDTAFIKAEIVRGNYCRVQDVKIQNGAKSILIDQMAVRHMKDLFGRLLIVMFAPEDLRLIKAGPSERRRFMDMEICQLSPIYYSDLREYHRALKQRNALLKILQKDKSQLDSLSIWDEQLQKYGRKITKTRESFISKINNISKEIHSHITQGKEDLTIFYTSSHVENLAKYHSRDIYQGTTGHGIHKDDINFTINGISARSFGSQGQQRTAALSAKLAEIEIIKQSTGETPVLLLDDVLSELDNSRQKFLLSKISDLQVIITCTGVEESLAALGEHRIMHVDGGEIAIKQLK